MKIHPLAMKVVLIGAVSGVLMIGVAFINELVNEREGRFREAAEEIGSSWGHPQTIAGPYVRLPLRPTVTKDGVTEQKTVVVLPESLRCAVNSSTQERHRGIYSVQLYSASFTADGSFIMPNLTAMGIDTSTVLWGQATVEFSLSDTRGIPTPLTIDWNGIAIELHPSSALAITSDEQNRVDARSGQHVIAARIAIDRTHPSGTSLSTYAIRFGLRGSESLSCVPLGKTTSFVATSDWPHPSFNGSILPARHETTNQGHRAEWTSGHFARSYPQAFIAEEVSSTRILSSAFGVSYVEPANLYQQLQRAVKYVVLVVLLTFALFFTLEVISKRRIHAMQYLFVGSALLVFYLMLTAISEVLRFDLAYSIAAFAVTALVTVYMRSVTKTLRYAGIVGGLLAALYVFIYVMLQAETYSLLIGSLGMFVAIATLMFTTRNIDWYSYGDHTA
ncbi:MAG: cell envelope integrity protein CreD [Ignavibacteria bacterium]|nr:cell envelope integrity protein CreD [Ignavibacteria bacterium]MBK7411121.1 cell envelope integrity protein CreD [Ignavibacteria bacterium]MBK7578121.1 cell envelope integrity protein CreD [Ignavibacteria bacterium]